MSVQYLQREGKPDLAYIYTPPASAGATLPLVMFLGGYRSDMQGTKAEYLEQQCKARGQAYVRFDYSGHGQSQGEFDDGTIGSWLGDATDILDHVASGPVVLVGSSMGGWIALLLAQKRAAMMHALIGIAAAPDFTEDIYCRLNGAQRQELEENGVAYVPNDIEIDKLEWMRADISGFSLKNKYALLVPGSAPQHPYKRWPAEKYTALAQKLAAADIQPVILGTNTETEIAAHISNEAPNSLNLCGQTSLEQIVTLARDAAIAIGNDTGPMHLIAATGVPCLTLFSHHSNPVRHKPKGANVDALQKENLDDLDVEAVWENLKNRNLV